MNSPQAGYQSAHMHQHQVPSRHVGSYSLGITSPLVRHSQYEYPPIGGVLVSSSSRVVEGEFGGYHNPHHSHYASNAPPLPAPGRQQYYGGSPSTAPPSGSGFQQQSSQQQHYQQRQGNNYSSQAEQQQQQQHHHHQPDAGLKQQQQQQQSQTQLPGQQQLQHSQSHQQLAQNKVNNAVEIGQQASVNNETVVQRGGNLNQFGAGSNGPAPFSSFQQDPNEKFFYEQDFASTRQQNGSKIGRGLLSPIYAHDEIESDQRVRKPLDEEQEKKLQKLKNEKTKRELHIQELDYRIHILEQENHSLRNQMDQMRNDYKRLNQVYEEKYSHEIDRLRLENQDYENSNKQWANRFKDIEQKCDDLVSEKQDLDEENRRLGEKILKIQVLLHEQPIKNQVRQENQSSKYG